ncbi:3-isopropylmalate dehydratase large subunit [Pseudomonas tolaasii]
MREPLTLLEKIWRRHEVQRSANGVSLLYIDRHYIHDDSMHAFDQMTRQGFGVRRPDRTVATADHYIPTSGGYAGFRDDALHNTAKFLRRNTERWGISHFDIGDPYQGIVHVVGPERGLTLPGMSIVCGDSHTSTHGALGALSFGIGASQVAHVLATQTVWQARPLTMRIRLNGKLPLGVTAKDMILHVISRLGTDAATGYMVEFDGAPIRNLSMEGRLTVCNMAIELGSRAGLIAPDETTFAYLNGRDYAPKGDLWKRAVEDWRGLVSDPDAVFDAERSVDISDIVPTVTWGVSPQDAVGVNGKVPDPANEMDPERQAQLYAALQYMGLTPNQNIEGIKVDRVFIGSCTNGRLEDLKAAAAVVKGRKAAVPALVVPGSMAVKAEAEALGLDRIFRDAGFDWRDAGCSMCVAMNGIDKLGPAQRCASTTNRNFRGRQGPGSRTHLMSPAMAAAAAVAGYIIDVRKLQVD